MKLLERCGMVDCKSVSTPMELNFKKLCGSAARPRLANPSKNCTQIFSCIIIKPSDLLR